ncbi:MAG: hypothetical protein ACR2PJ_06640 [Pseudomonadales bacterium]
MMQALAEFTMRSRLHATGASMLAAVLPLLGWLSAVIIALAVLRFGSLTGLLILLWTLLPTSIIFYQAPVGDPSMGVLLVSSFMLAVLLRQTVSWELVLLACVGLTAVIAALLETTTTMSALFARYFKVLEQSLGTTIEPAEAMTAFMGIYALAIAYLTLAALVVARWCQGALYNPGGFGKEFRALRLSPGVSAGVAAVMLVCMLLPEQFGRWLPLVTLPLVFAAIGLAHWLVKTRGLPNHLVAVFYIALVLLYQLVYPMLAAVALVDSWLNIRPKIQTNQEGNQ